MVNDYIYKRSIYSETPEGTGRAEDYRLRLSPRKASLYNTKHDNKKEARRRFLSKSSSSYLFWYLCPRLFPTISQVFMFKISITKLARSI